MTQRGRTWWPTRLQRGPAWPHLGALPGGSAVWGVGIVAGRRGGGGVRVGGPGWGGRVRPPAALTHFPLAGDQAGVAEHLLLVVGAQHVALAQVGRHAGGVDGGDELHPEALQGAPARVLVLIVGHGWGWGWPLLSRGPAGAQDSRLGHGGRSPRLPSTHPASPPASPGPAADPPGALGFLSQGTLVSVGGGVETLQGQGGV